MKKNWLLALAALFVSSFTHVWATLPVKDDLKFDRIRSFNCEETQKLVQDYPAFAAFFAPITRDCDKDSSNVSRFDESYVDTQLVKFAAQRRPQETAANFYEVSEWDQRFTKLKSDINEIALAQQIKAYNEFAKAKQFPSLTELANKDTPEKKLRYFFARLSVYGDNPVIALKIDKAVFLSDFAANSKQYLIDSTVAFSCIDVVNMLNQHPVAYGVYLSPLFEACFQDSTKPVTAGIDQFKLKLDEINKRYIADGGSPKSTLGLNDFWDLHKRRLSGYLAQVYEAKNAERRKQEAAEAEKNRIQSRLLEEQRRRDAEKERREQQIAEQKRREEAEQKRWDSLTPAQKEAENRAVIESENRRREFNCRTYAAALVMATNANDWARAGAINSAMNSMRCRDFK